MSFELYNLLIVLQFIPIENNAKTYHFKKRNLGISTIAI